MTREEAKKYLPIIQAYIDGKQVQWLDETGRWHDANDKLLTFYSPPSNYRIKPESKYKPFKTKEECWNEMHKHPDFGWVKFCNSICFIQNISFNKITVISDEEICSTSFEGGFTNMKFADGTPFGIKEESDEQ